jgi:hypothetical protein
MAANMADGKSASRKFEEEAARWETTGEMQESGSNEYRLTVLRCWITSDGAEADGVSERLKRYYQAAEERIEMKLGPDWYDRFLRTRDACSICGQGFRLENLGMCTHCDALIGYCHQFDGGTASNGNLKCPRCEHGETVG